MKILIIENLKTGEADLEPYIPMPGQIAMVEGTFFKCSIVDSELVALSYLDTFTGIKDLKIDNESIKYRIIRALELSNWIQKDAAKLLGISSRAICYRCKLFDIFHEGWQEGKKSKKLKLKVIRSRTA